jgi:arsenite oxidase small subunit
MSADLSRRFFLLRGGALAATTAAAVGCSNELKEKESPTYNLTLPYPEAAVAKAGQLQAGTPHYFNYPDLSSPCILLKVGRRVVSGAGPDGDIVAYSRLCSHRGCPLTLDEQRGVLKCHCHYSMFDPEQGGQMIVGQATVNVPQILLSYRSSDDSVLAVGIHGLIYGRASNLL